MCPVVEGDTEHCGDVRYQNGQLIRTMEEKDMAKRDETDEPDTGSGVAFEVEGDLPPGVPVDPTPTTDYGKNVEEKGGGPVGVKVPEEKD